MLKEHIKILHMAALNWGATQYAEFIQSGSCTPTDVGAEKFLHFVFYFPQHIRVFHFILLTHLSPSSQCNATVLLYYTYRYCLADCVPSAVLSSKMLLYWHIVKYSIAKAGCTMFRVKVLFHICWWTLCFCVGLLLVVMADIASNANCPVRLFTSCCHCTSFSAPAIGWILSNSNSKQSRRSSW